MRKWLILLIVAFGCGKDSRNHPASYWAERLQSTELSTRLEAVDMLARCDPEDKDLIPTLVTALGDASEEVAQKASAALRAIGQPAIAALVEALKSDQTAVRQHAVVILCGNPSLPDTARKPLLKMLQDPNVTVRVRTSEALANSPSLTAAAVPALRDALDDDSELVRFHAATALGKIGTFAKDAIPDLQKALQDSDPDVRRAASEALRRIQ